MTTSATARSGTLTATRTDGATSVGLLLLRLVAGALLLVHGIPKLSDPSGVVGAAGGLGVPAPEVAGWLLIAGEVGLGALLVLGLLTRIAGALVLVQMSLVWLLVHRPDGFLVDGQVNGENAILLAAAGLTLALTGAGRLSADAGRR
ncbi:DoxX family membrane protein [Kineococcus sp. R8]|uniref:DoxX family protein n=1 Tax=Kineococcus siccus TaxID=2696567 RepID=UPI00141233E8|nr:DoxX family protein [Kineococcus siccus]NAZ83095.1 DoxX family membrane protein [Kineococcus siccus]